MSVRSALQTVSIFFGTCNLAHGPWDMRIYRVWEFKYWGEKPNNVVSGSINLILFNCEEFFLLQKNLPHNVQKSDIFNNTGFSKNRNSKATYFKY